MHVLSPMAWPGLVHVQPLEISRKRQSRTRCESKYEMIRDKVSSIILIVVLTVRIYSQNWMLCRNRVLLCFTLSTHFRHLCDLMKSLRCNSKCTNIQESSVGFSGACDATPIVCAARESQTGVSVPRAHNSSSCVSFSNP